MKENKSSDVKKYLRSLSKDEMEKELLNLIKIFKEVKEYYSIKLNGDNSDEILTNYKDKILNEFFPKRGHGKFNFTNIRKTISNFKKISSNPRQIADLVLYSVEQGVKFTNTYGSINERFYISLEKLFDEATKFIKANKIAEDFVKRCKKIVSDSASIGWGFSDAVEDIISENLSDYIEIKDE